MSGEPPEARERRRAEPAGEARRRLELVIAAESEPPPPPEGAPVKVLAADAQTPIAATIPATRPEPAPEPARGALLGRVPFGRREDRMIRSLAGWLGLTALATFGVCAVFATQWAQGRGSVPSAVAAVLTGAIGTWSLLAGWHFGRVVRTDHDDAQHLVSAFSNLRSILILKAIGLFLVLGLSCFAFSIVASLLALL